MKDLFFFALAACLSIPAMAQEKYEQGKPGNDNYRYLDGYDALKEYIDYSKYPNFKLGAGTTVNDYLNNQTYRKMINSNFTETVAGNAMKMASCVDGNGKMNFNTVKSYVNTATAAGLNVYGHTLAWHSQQPKGWLLKLLADKPDPNGGVEYTVVASKDFRTSQNIVWSSDKSQYGFSVSFDATNGLHVGTTRTCDNFWDVQFVVENNINLESGKTYRLTMTIKGSKSGSLHSKLGDWGDGSYSNISFGTEWQDVAVNYTPIMDVNFLMLQCG